MARLTFERQPGRAGRERPGGASHRERGELVAVGCGEALDRGDPVAEAQNAQVQVAHLAPGPEAVAPTPECVVLVDHPGVVAVVLERTGRVAAVALDVGVP